MSQTIVSVLVLILAQVFPMLGIQIGSEALTTTITTILSIGAALWIWARRYQQGDINLSGTRK